MSTSTKRYKSFKEFYPFYLKEHSLPINRLLHFTGTFLILVIVALVMVYPKWWMFLFIPLAGYGFAWAGHFIFEKNKPATFKHPLWSLASDFVMFWHMLTGQIGKKMKEAYLIMGDAKESGT